MPKKVYTVRQDKQSGNWEATETGGGILVSSALKADVQKEAIRVAKQQESASVRIKGRDGKIQEERTYPRSADPRNSKG